MRDLLVHWVALLLGDVLTVLVRNLAALLVWDLSTLLLGDFLAALYSQINVSNTLKQ